MTTMTLDEQNQAIALHAALTELQAKLEYANEARDRAIAEKRILVVELDRMRAELAAAKAPPPPAPALEPEAKKPEPPRKGDVVLYQEKDAVYPAIVVQALGNDELHCTLAVMTSNDGCVVRTDVPRGDGDVAWMPRL